MKEKLITIVKYFKFLYVVYYYVVGFLLRILKVFVKPDNELILINSFGGKKYDDSPRAIFEAMINDVRFNNYKFVWAFHNPEKFNINCEEIVKTDTFKYFKIALKARCWITNSSIERGLDFKGKNTFYFNTWHGTPIKKMGSDIHDYNKSFKKNKKENFVDIMCSQSNYETNIFSEVFNIPKDNFLECGLPRNDILVNYSENEKNQIKSLLNIPLNKRVILYAPTYREFERDRVKKCVSRPPINIKKWQEHLEEEYVFLFRAHYEVGKIMNITDNEFVRNMSDYPILNDLMIISDILISDYSSMFFDFSIMEKPMFHFAYDYDKYASERGMYFDIRDMLSGSNNENELIEILKKFDETEEKSKAVAFKNKYVNYYGNAVLKSLDCIYKNIGGKL